MRAHDVVVVCVWVSMLWQRLCYYWLLWKSSPCSCGTPHSWHNYAPQEVILLRLLSFLADISSQFTTRNPFSRDAVDPWCPKWKSVDIVANCFRSKWAANQTIEAKYEWPQKQNATFPCACVMLTVYTFNLFMCVCVCGMCVGHTWHSLADLCAWWILFLCQSRPLSFFIGLFSFYCCFCYCRFLSISSPLSLSPCPTHK